MWSGAICYRKRTFETRRQGSQNEEGETSKEDNID